MFDIGLWMLVRLPSTGILGLVKTTCFLRRLSSYSSVQWHFQRGCTIWWEFSSLTYQVWQQMLWKNPGKIVANPNGYVYNWEKTTACPFSLKCSVLRTYSSHWSGTTSVFGSYSLWPRPFAWPETLCKKGGRPCPCRRSRTSARCPRLRPELAGSASGDGNHPAPNRFLLVKLDKEGIRMNSKCRL